MKNNITCIIVDDEPWAIGLLEESLSSLYSNLEIIKKCTSWNDALLFLRTTECDLIFIDIMMPGKSGIDMLTLLPRLKAELIFVTAHTEYALKALKFHPTGYVLKPIDEQDLVIAVDKAIERITHKKKAQMLAQQGQKIGIPNTKGVDYLNVDDILYLEAINNCTKVAHTTGVVTSSYPLNKFQSVLEKYNFYKVHRSFIVNTNHVRKYVADGSIFMSDGYEIPISKNVRENFLKQFEKISRF